MAKLRDRVFGHLYEGRRNASTIGIYATLIVGVIGIALTIYLSKKEILIKIEYNWTLILLTLLCFVLLVALAYFVLQDRARYAEAQAHTHHAAHVMRDYLAAGDYDDTKTKETIETVLKSLAHLFSTITSTNCWASLKQYDSTKNLVSCTNVVYNPNNSFQDDIDLDTGYEVSKFSSVKTLLNVISEPKRLMEEVGRFYLCQNLHESAEKGKYNHPKLETSHRSGYNRLRKRYGNWPLHASSCLVIPVRWIDETNSAEPIADFKGFLCVDSASTNIFSKRYDVHLAATYADILYSIMHASQKP